MSLASTAGCPSRPVAVAWQIISRYRLWITVAHALAFPAEIALAQSVNENAVTESDDAFGRSVGDESTGLYSAREVRGFSPIDAGNVRMDELYFDQVNNPSYRMLDGTTIRVGFSTLGYSFPAPSGLVDYALTDYGTETTLTLDINGETDKPFPNLAAELRVAIDGHRLGLYAGGAALFQKAGDGREHRMATYGAVATWRPMPGGELSAFIWRSTPRDEEARLTLFAPGDILPPEIERGIDLSQPWADTAKDNRLVGVMAHLPLGAGVRVDAGLFSDRTAEMGRFADLLNGVAPDGSVAERVIVADAGGRDHSLSGEVRLVKQFRTGFGQHRITGSLRGRDRDRRFGGARRLSLGPSTILERDVRPEQAFTPGPKNSDAVRQFTYGAAYAGFFFDRLVVDASLSRSKYTKRVDFADPALADVATRDSPLLWNASAVFDLTDSLSVLAGMSRGMEDALVAPDRAINRAEAPPAIRTEQKEIGLRYVAGEWLTAVVGAFRIEKPYYNLDPDLRYRLLGTVVGEGIEASMVVRPAPGLTILGGALLNNPHIIGEAVDSGLVGPQPVGLAETRLVGNVNWRLAGGRSPLSFDVAFEHTDGRVGNSTNTLELPGKTVIDVGFRYRFTLGPADMLFRAKVTNILNDYSWDAAPSGGLTYIDPRRYELQLVADF